MSDNYEPGRLRLDGNIEIVTATNPADKKWPVKIAHVRPSTVEWRREANARRLVACWNACEGIDTADLDVGSVSIIHKLHDEVAKLVLAQRDELLAALQGILGYFDSGNSVPVSQATIRAGSDEVKAARAAIAKVEGGA